jgi:two-component sensor histidine kinase/CHASE1-domain containing sensor protein
MGRPRSRTKRWLVRYPRGVPVAIFLLVAAITALSVFAIERGENQRAEAQLRGEADAVASALERRANASSAYLRAGAALIATLDEVPAPLFRRFVSELRLDADYKGAEGIGWAMVVPPARVGAFNALMDASAPGDVALHPAMPAGQPYAVPVTFLQPDTERNRRALAYDMYSDPVRRAGMLEAERTARPTATGKVVLEQEGAGSEPGFLIYMPVFSSDEHGRHLKGFIYSPFNAQDFLASALELERPGLFGIRLYDREANRANLLAEISHQGQLGSSYTLPVTIANHPWVLEIESPRPTSLSGLSMLTLVFGLLVASLLMLVVRMLTQQATEDEAALHWFEEQASIRNSLTRELNHRVKNTLANVLSIIALTRRRATSLDEFVVGLDGRIRALSATHDLLTQSDWGTTQIRAVVDAELAPYVHTPEHRIEIEGPDIPLAPNDALSLGLAIHELATNAAKYGALTQSGGQVSVRWEVIAPHRVRLEWRERGGPPVKTLRGRGFGTDLIEKIVANELDSPVQLLFEPEGVTCVLTIPVRQPTAFAIRAPRNGGASKPGEDEAK